VPGDDTYLCGMIDCLSGRNVEPPVLARSRSCRGMPCYLAAQFSLAINIAGNPLMGWTLPGITVCQESTAAFLYRIPRCQRAAPGSRT
jgi:hypothetical protein